MSWFNQIWILITLWETWSRNKSNCYYSLTVMVKKVFVPFHFLTMKSLRFLCMPLGGHYNIKMPPHQSRDSHYKDEKVLLNQPSGISEKLCHQKHIAVGIKAISYIVDLLQERHNSIANALELCLSCINLLISSSFVCLIASPSLCLGFGPWHMMISCGSSDLHTPQGWISLCI